VIVWVDAQLPPQLANWLATTFGVDAQALVNLGLRDANDLDIFERAKAAGSS
jgi:predicted nuclease of predicted toxin-antitoxin system